MNWYRYSKSWVSLLTAVSMLPFHAYANPVDGVVAAGSATMSESGAKLDIYQSTDKVIIDWRSFDIGAGEHTEFHQPSSSSMALNRINSGSPTEILGKLSANGNVLVLNPSGVIFGAGSQVDVNGLVATTSNISNANFMAGDLKFDTPGNANASVINQGTITAKQAGLVGLVAPNVSNSGVITAQLGRVELASGDTFTVDMYGDGLMNIALSDDVTKQVVENKGRIEAAGGVITLTAAAGGHVVNSLVNIEGELKTPSVAQKNGKIIISGDVVSHTGTIDASGATGGSVSIKGKKIAQQGKILADGTSGAAGNIDIAFEQAYIDSESSRVSATSATQDGGSIAVKGDTGSHAFISGNYDTSSANAKGGQVAITAAAGDLKLYGAHVNADGKTGGGTIHIGGEYQGTGTLAHAATTSVNFATTLSANALESGTGGNIIVWSDETTLFGGKAYAKGGSISGDGGLIELSSKDMLQIAGAAITDASSPFGNAGRLLLDPKNIIVATGGITGGISSVEFVDPNADTGSFAGSVTLLTNGNVVITDTGDDFAATDAGAVYLFNGATGALISTLTGSTASDAIGTFVKALTNGNFVTASSTWDNGATADVGATTWGSGTTGVAGVVGAVNSLIGGGANDRVGSDGITALTNGNYVVASSNWNNGAAWLAGAVTWGDGAGGTVGTVSAANSLVGSHTSDKVGVDGIVALTNGNYVVKSTLWDDGVAGDVGAATWGNGMGGTVGAVSAANSLVGSHNFDNIGTNILALSNGNYIASSIYWDNGAATNAGAVTWGNGAGGTVGVVSAANSLVGSTTNDKLSNGGITALTNGNYVVNSPFWDNGAVTDVGAVTWGSGTAGVSGVISAANSLIGSTTGDLIGANGVTALTNGNYVVGSYSWDNGGTANVGAATWGNGLGGTVGAVSAANSIIGSTANDWVGYVVTALTNGNYVVGNYWWDNGAAADAGAATWGNGLGGTVGVVSAANSLIGSSASDQVGSSIAALTNGNYVVDAYGWDNGGTASVGAVTWGNGTTGITGVVSAANSLVGSTANDNVGFGGILALSNGNYVVDSASWDNGAVVNAGAVTWGNGTTGITGVVSAANSLVGSTANDNIGFASITALSNGNYVVVSANWDNGATANVGAVTWANGTTGITGVISSANSVIGSTANDNVGSGGLTVMGSNKFAIRSANWDNGATANAGAVTFFDSNAATTGVVSSTNSFLGTIANGSLQTLTYDSVNDRILARFTAAAAQRAYSVAPATLGNYDSFADSSTATITLDPSFITAVLNAGTAVTLQASNDITINNAIIANNGAGNGGTFTLQAGRSILINDDITTDNGNLNIFANEKLATGVVNAQRDAGAAVITMGAGAALNAGSGDVVIRLDDGTGKTNLAAGDITLRDITANSILARNNNTTGDMVLASGQLTASGGGDAIILSSLRNFINSAGAGVMNLTGAGRYLVYSTAPGSDTVGGLTPAFTQYGCVYGGACSLGAGNGLVYSSAGGGGGGGGGSSGSSSTDVPSTYWYVSQTPLPNLLQGLSVLADPAISGSRPAVQPAFARVFEVGLNPTTGQHSYSLLNGWIAIAPPLAQWLGIDQEQI